MMYSFSVDTHAFTLSLLIRSCLILLYRGLEKYYCLSLELFVIPCIHLMLPSEVFDPGLQESVYMLLKV